MRTFLLIAAFVSVLATKPASAQTPAREAPTGAARAELMQPALPAIDSGLDYLAGIQEEDGSFGAGFGKNAAVVGLSGIAFLGSGSSPGRGPYGESIDRCIDFIIDNTQSSGFISIAGATSQGPMYGHGFATLFLAEAYGMSPREDLRDKLADAVGLIVSTQNKEGGWRYQPRPVDADLSVTICQIMALRAARNAGIEVPVETVERCIDYVRQCQNPDGGFGYMPTDRSSLFPRSAAGVVALYSAGIYEGPEITRGIAYLKKNAPNDRTARRSGHYLYGQYYGAQAMWHAGSDTWSNWYTRTRDTLIASQQPGGSWFDSVGPHYATAMACIVLQTPNDILPIFQR